jgi:hypothetical protein
MRFRLPQLFLLWSFFTLAVMGMGRQAPTFDEQGFLVRGLAYLRGEHRQIRVGHPLGLNALNASLLIHDNTIQLPVDDPSWQGNNFHRPAELFLWEIGNQVERVMFLARLPTIWLAALMTAVAGRWAREITGRQWAGILAMALLAFDPNILAHSQLATTDLGLAAATLFVGYALWRYGRQPTWPHILLFAVAFSLLINTKFTAGLFVPLIGLNLLFIWLAAWRNRENGRFTAVSWQIFVAFPLTAFVALWAAYSFQIGTLPADLPTLPQLGGLTLPLSHYLEQLLDIGGRLQKETPAFLLGNYSTNGWPYYFPVAFLLKTPLPTLLLLAAAAILWLRGAVAGRRPFNLGQLIALPPLGYFAFALTSEINLGYRHLLPILPFTAVFIAAVLTRANDELQITNYKLPITNYQFAIPLLLLWLAANALWIHPHHLAFFNGLAGGADNGWRYLADSNIDWGQDLANLKGWMDDNGVDHIWLSYFGEGRPEYYGISYTGLDSFPPRLMNPAARPFYPHDPAPGVYAISATNLQGVLFQNHGLYAWFREREPIDKVGYSIFIYEVAPYGEPADLYLGGGQLDEISPELFARLQTNQVTPRWFDPGQALMVGSGTNSWLWLDGEMAPVLRPFLPTAPDRLSPLPADSATAVINQTASWMSHGIPFRQDGGTISLLATEILTPADNLPILTLWRQDGPPRPTKIFIHLLDEQGELTAQWDGLDAAWEGWREGDLLLHLHQLKLPPNLPPGLYQLWTGLYHPDDWRRWETAVSDRALIGPLEISR